jgi:hypothetical protein
MDISQELKSHFSRLPKYTTPRGIIFYDRKDYDNYIKDEKIYKQVPISIQSKK